MKKEVKITELLLGLNRNEVCPAYNFYIDTSTKQQFSLLKDVSCTTEKKKMKAKA
jgi:hypothetical protein